MFGIYSWISLAGGGLEFASPTAIPLSSGAVSVAAGDFDGDGKLELATAHGTKEITLLTRGSPGRADWKGETILAGVGIYSIRSADFDGDGFDDLVAADPASAALFLRSRGDGTFEEPQIFSQARNSRGIALGDYNGDGNLDIATADHNLYQVAIYLGLGTGRFQPGKTFCVPGEPHDIASLDYNGDGHPDLLIAMAEGGIQPLEGTGEGTFLLEPPIPRGARFLTTADFNGDGWGDFVSSGTEATAGVWISRGDGTFNRTDLGELSNPGAIAFGDLNGDGMHDLVLAPDTIDPVTWIQVHIGRGDGTFLPPLSFGPIPAPNLLLITDLDGDGPSDVVSTDRMGLSVVWGREGELFLDVGRSLGGFTPSGGYSLADLDGDGLPDLFLSSAVSREIFVCLKPGLTSPSLPDITIDVPELHHAFRAVDLDGDDIPDLLGIHRFQNVALVTLLNASGQVRSSSVLPTGKVPWAVAAGRLNDDDEIDLAVACRGPGPIITLYPGRGGGAFSGMQLIPTLQNPRSIVLDDVDLDGRRDLVVISNNQVGVHYGEGALSFSEPVLLGDGEERNYSAGAVADLDGDAAPDIILTELLEEKVLLFPGRGTREFGNPIELSPGGPPLSLGLADLNGDGLLDLSATELGGKVLGFFRNLGGMEFAGPEEYPLGFSPLLHTFEDLDGDGLLDLVAFQATGVLILPGRPAVQAGERFRRGDANVDGEMDLSDVIRILSRLFQGGDPFPCQDAADANDDGGLDLSDPIALIGRLFQGSGPLPPPGPGSCGPDPTPDGLEECRAGCPEEER